MQVLWAIAANTWKQFVRDRIFYLVLIVALVLMGFSYFLATLTIIESRKILLDFGFSAASIAGGLMGIYLGIAAVAKEIELKTIYTILAKPVSRGGYLLGKFLGSVAVLAAGNFFLGLTIYFILRVAGETMPPGFYSCLLLIFMESVILLSVAAFFSCFSSSILAAGLTVAFFLIGRSNESFLMMSQKAMTSEVRAVARVFYYGFPNLERYNIRDVVAYGKPFPEQMVGLGAFYLLAYVTFALAAAALIFRRRDLP